MSYCDWDKSSELNTRYHDLEWGVPLHDDRGQFEFLMMEVMQCGLNWTMMILHPALKAKPMILPKIIKKNMIKSSDNMILTSLSK